MRKKLCALFAALLLLAGCGGAPDPGGDTGLQVAATAYPVYLLASAVTAGAEGVTLTPVVNQSVACLHDYTLTISDMKKLDRADAILINGAGLEASMADALAGKELIDCSQGIALHSSEEDDHDHDHGHTHAHGDEDGDHEDDPHIWMDPLRAAQMVQNIAEGLAALDPDNAELYRANAQAESDKLTQFTQQAREALSALSCRDLITFHEGFGYFAETFDLHILAAVEEEAGSEASAKTLKEIVALIQEYDLPAIFVEANGSTATADAIHRECGVPIQRLSMLMSGPAELGPEDTYEAYMQANIDTILEALS